MNKILYTWSGSDEIESFGPSCAIINRCLSYLNIDFDIKSIVLGSELTGAKEKLTGLPIIQNGDKKYFGIRNSLKYLMELRSESDLFEIADDQIIQEQMIREWALNVLRASCVYMTFKDPSGYSIIKKKFFKAAKYQLDKQDHLETVAEPIRKALLESTNAHDIYSLELDKAREHFEKQIKYLDTILQSNQFLLGNQIKLVDIIAYCHLSSAFLSASDFVTNLRPKHPRVTRWLLRVAGLTRSKNNIHPAHLD
ncbi:glutathione S-transferase family protein [Halobacteriovorax sp.]|uniref:glutathione S-transferase family protein n=1 Tax=Halobacteriovorax sp. TaxID=2020862 RepID=UPI003AF2CDFA